MEKLVSRGFKKSEGMLGPGVYGLLYKCELVYIGRAKEVLTRIYSHRLAWRNYRKGITKHLVKVIRFDDFMVLPCAEKELAKLEKQLIVEFRPRMNAHHRESNPIDLVKIGLVDKDVFNRAMIRVLGVEGVEERRA